MRLSVAKGRMYPWVDYCANPLGGKCPNDCVYCYVKDLGKYSQVRKKYSGRLRVSRKSLDVPTGKHRVRRRKDVPFVPSDVPIIFVCSSNDLGTAPIDVQIEILRNCCDYPSYWYLIQSKCPGGLIEVEDYFPPNIVLGTTIETNRKDLCKLVSNAPSPKKRIDALDRFGGYLKMVSIEPVLECDPLDLSELIACANPDFVSIGADRKGKHNLQEPNWGGVLNLISELQDFTVVFKKDNLSGLYKRSA